ncbi:hypothetical protein BASA50_001912 [Batrachochytrium salamandrivorans]|uniref:CNH domain-containing protein n=1 Tax=Batrachochytrium salamandrivorans TaxID=1357716 RepID=A0ABQ8FMU0_9FUNG|nr:hypothetical protein BASA50_001912 [Batrachochytrium salamandrivorans]
MASAQDLYVAASEHASMAMPHPEPFELVFLATALNMPPIPHPQTSPQPHHHDNPLASALGSASAIFGSFSSIAASSSASTTTPTTSTTGHGASTSNLPEDSHSTSRPVFGAVELCGNDLYVGTSDGSLEHYHIDPVRESVDSQLKTRFITRKAVSASKRAVQSIMAIPTESLLAVYVDGNLDFYHLDTLLSVAQAKIPSIKRVTAYCADRTIQSPLSFTVAKRRSISNYLLDDRLVLQKDVSVLDGAQIMAQDEYVICAADTQTYKLVRLDTGVCTPLFPYEKSQMTPVAVLVGDGEFLLATSSAQGVGLGVFISSAGEPIRGTLQWPSVPIFMVFQFPYVFTLLRNNMLQIHNATSQELVQSITFPVDSPAQSMSISLYALEIKVASGSEKELDAAIDEGSTAPGALSVGTVHVVISFREEILGLAMVPWEIQVDRLLKAGSIQPGVALAEQMLSQDEGSLLNKNKLARIYIRSGILFVQDAKFSLALDYFRKGRIDPRALMFLFPDIRPSSYLAIPEGYARQWMNDMDTIDTIIAKAVQKNPEDPEDPTKSSLEAALKIEAQDMLASYLSDLRKSKISRINLRNDIDSTLLKLYAEDSTMSMYDILAGPNDCVVSECDEYLASRHRFFAQSLLYKGHGMYEQCLELWIRMASGDIVDVDFVGMSLIVDLLIELNDSDLILKFALWVLRRDPVRGVKIFTDRTDGLFESQQVLEVLESFGSRALLTYIEYLVMRQGNKDPALHTRLGMLYIDAIEHMATNDNITAQAQGFLNRKSKKQTFVEFMRDIPDPFAVARLVFVDFVEQSEFANISALQHRLDQLLPLMFLERATLLAKSQSHVAVLELLAFKIHDYVAAERYCLQAKQASVVLDSTHKSESTLSVTTVSLIYQLVSMYIGASTDLKHEKRVDCTNQAVYLLTVYFDYLDAVELLNIMPNSWGISMLAPFVQAANSQSMREQRKYQIIKALARGENTQIQKTLIDAHQSRSPVFLPREPFYVCSICTKPLRDPTLFVQLSNFQLVHFKCHNSIQPK